MKNNIFTIKVIMLVVVFSLLQACGGGSSESPGGSLAPTPEFSTQNHDIYLPDGVETLSLPVELDGVYVFDGNDGTSTVAPAGNSLSRAIGGVETSERDVAGIAIQLAAFNSEESSAEMLVSINGLINSIASSNFSKKQKVTSGSNDAINAQLEVTLSTQEKPTDLLNKIILLLSADVSAEQLTPALDVESAFSRFTMNVGIVFFDTEDVMVSITLVPSDLLSDYASVVTKITDTGNVLQKGTNLKSATDTFTGQASGGIADFLFVVDNSGSMFSQQAALSDAADAFVTVIESSGLDYNVGVITTDSQVLRGSGFTTDTEQFKLDAKPGTGGSATESGIYFAEQALMSIAEGDESDGSVTMAEYPRNGASLSVIFVSDEPNSYRGFPDFDAQNNLFLDRNYTSFAIINEYSRTYGEYDELADNSGGFTADIDDTALFPEIMNNIAQAAGGAASWYALSETPVSSTIEVTVNGVIVGSSLVNGWTYSGSSNSIIFHGDAIPAEGASVVVNYFHGVTAVAPAAGGAGAAGSTDLAGSWYTDCITDGAFSSINSKLDFTADSYDMKFSTYDDNSCGVLNTIYTETGTYEVGAEVSVSSGGSAHELNITQLTEDGVVVSEKIFDIFRIDGTNLYFGDTRGGNDGTLLTKRPTDLDLSLFFKRQ